MSFSSGAFDGAKQETLHHVGHAITPTAIALHYTVTDTLSAAVNALNNRGLSYTFLIDRDGTITQTRSPDRHAASSGRSHWKAANGLTNTSSLNRSTVAISFVSRGFFSKLKNGFAFDTNAHGNFVGETYPESEVERAPSTYDPGWSPIWHKYTDAQIASAERLVPALKAEFPSITDIIGHDDCAIGGKFDTGPLFPIQRFREEFDLKGALGFRTKIRSPDGVAELRRGASSRHKSLGQLHTGDTVHIRAFAYSTTHSRALVVDRPSRRYITGWASVDVDGSNTHAGFVHASLFEDTPLVAALKAKL